MSTQSLGQYFRWIVQWSQGFIDSLPNDFLHSSSKTAYQLMNEIDVYLRSGALTKKEYTTVTKKTEQLIEEVEKLEIAYEEWKWINHTDEFSDAFKSNFDGVMQHSTLKEKLKTWLWRQYVWTYKVSLFFKRFEVPLLLASIARWMICLSLWVDTMSLFLLLVLVALCLLIWLLHKIIQWWRILVGVMAVIVLWIF